MNSVSEKDQKTFFWRKKTISKTSKNGTKLSQAE